MRKERRKKNSSNIYWQVIRRDLIGQSSRGCRSQLLLTSSSCLPSSINSDIHHQNADRTAIPPARSATYVTSSCSRTRPTTIHRSPHAPTIIRSLKATLPARHHNIKAPTASLHPETVHLPIFTPIPPSGPKSVILTFPLPPPEPSHSIPPPPPQKPLQPPPMPPTKSSPPNDANAPYLLISQSTARK